MIKSFKMFLVMFPFIITTSLITFLMEYKNVLRNFMFGFQAAPIWGIIFGIGLLVYFKFFEDQKITLLNGLLFILSSTFGSILAFCVISMGGFFGAIFFNSNIFFIFSCALGGYLGTSFLVYALKKTGLATVKYQPVVWVGAIIPFLYFSFSCARIDCYNKSYLPWLFVVIWQLIIAAMLGFVVKSEHVQPLTPKIPEPAN